MPNNVDITQIIDANWLATILSIVFSIYIFLLGVPILFFQTFMPEDLRSLYNRIFKDEQSDRIKSFSLWILFFSIFIANHLFKYALQRILPQFEYVNKHIEAVFIIINLIILLLFIIFFYKSLSFFKSFVFSQKNVKNAIIDKVVATGDIDDLKYISLIFTQGAEKKYLILRVKEAILSKISVDNYNGELVERYFNEVIIDSICFVKENLVERELLSILILASDCQSKLNLFKKNINHHISNIDQRSINNCVYSISNIALERQCDEAFSKSLDLLYDLPDIDDNYFFRICYKTFLIKPYERFIAGKLGLMLNSIEESKGIMKLNTIAIASWFISNENPKMTEFAYPRLLRALEQKLITYEDLCDAEDEFELFFDTSLNISKLKDLHFSNEVYLNKLKLTNNQKH